MTFYDELVADGRARTERLVRVERGADRALVTLADPGKLNVLSAPLVQQLEPRSRSSSPTARSARSC